MKICCWYKNQSKLFSPIFIYFNTIIEHKLCANYCLVYVLFTRHLYFYFKPDCVLCRKVCTLYLQLDGPSFGRAAASLPPCTISSNLHSKSAPDWGFTLNTRVLMLHANIEME